ncbi:MAG: PEP-CTERM sorting domain-containing protein [Planctomycetota bacterium]
MKNLIGSKTLMNGLSAVCVSVAGVGSAHAAVFTDITIFESGGAFADDMNFNFLGGAGPGGTDNFGFEIDPAQASVTLDVFSTTVAGGFSTRVDTGTDLTITTTSGNFVSSGFGGALGVSQSATVDEALNDGETLIFTFTDPVEINAAGVFFADDADLVFTPVGGTAVTLSGLGGQGFTGALPSVVSVAANQSVEISAVGGTLFVDDLGVDIVPEPGTLALAGLAGAVTLLRRRVAD